MVPDTELNALHQDAATAVMLAVDGKVSNGMELLLAGLRRVEEMQLDEAWAGEMACRYRKAIHGYGRRFGYGPALLLDLPERVCTGSNA